MTGKHEAPGPGVRDGLKEYAAVRDEIIGLLESARKAAARTGRIVEAEQRGRRRADYGERLIERLATDRLRRFGRGFSRQSLQQMRALCLAWPSGGAAPSLSATVAANLHPPDVARRFPLPWSAYVQLLSVKDPDARAFYKYEALRAGWSVRQLDRQIASQFYERIALSKNKAAMLKKARATRLEDEITPEAEGTASHDASPESPGLRLGAVDY